MKMVRLRVLVFIVAFLASVSGFAADPISAEAVIERVMPAIVAIRADTSEGIATGTGSLVDSTRAWLRHRNRISCPLVKYLCNK